MVKVIDLVRQSVQHGMEALKEHRDGLALNRKTASPKRVPDLREGDKTPQPPEKK